MIVKIKEYAKKAADQNNEILNRIKKIQSDITGVVEDVEANAEAIEELAQIVGGGE